MDLPANEVHVWQASLDVESRPPEAFSLSDEEERRAERQFTPTLRSRFVSSRWILRRVLAGYLGARPEDLEFGAGVHGKPSLDAPATDLRFNLSHSGPCWALAVGRERELGIDVERTTRKVDINGVSRRMFAASELESLRGLEGREKIDAFFRCWTSREAIVKGMGQGMFITKEEFDVECRPGKRIAVRRAAETSTAFSWRIGLIPLPPGFCGVLATPGLPSRIRSWLVE
jgi:4'-phosphopantetheinyl transferase